MANRTPSGRKRDQQTSNKENDEPVAKPSDSPLRKKARTDASNPAQAATKLTDKDKFEKILAYISSLNWTFSACFYYAFRLHKDDGTAIERSHSHATTIHQFLAGLSKYKPCHLIDAWIRSPDGRLERDSEDMFSITKPFTEIHPVQPCLTSFAAQLVEKKLLQEANSAVKPSSGLHAIVAHKSSLKKAKWVDIGATTVPEVARVLKEHQSLTWHYLTKIAARKPRVRKGVASVRKHRPVEAVSFLIITVNSRKVYG